MTDFRKLCAELINVWDSAIDQDLLDMHEAVERARVALAESEPKEPTQRQLMMLADAMGMTSVGDAAEYAHAVLTRWGK